MNFIRKSVNDRFRYLMNLFIATTLLFLIWGCESGSMGEKSLSDAGNGIDDSGISVAGIDGSGVVSTGPVDSFGSIIVNGVRFDIDTATITLNGEPATEEELALGMYVNVVGTFHEDGVSGTATHVEFTFDLSGPLESVSSTSSREYQAVTVMGQTVLVHQRETVYQGTTFDTIAQSAWLNVSGLVVTDGQIVASYVESVDLESQSPVRFTAEITAIDGQRLTLSNEVIVDVSEAVLVSDDSTAIDNGYEIGQRIEVIGERVVDELIDEIVEPIIVNATTVDLQPGFKIPDADTEEGELFTIMGAVDALTDDTQITVLDADIDISGATRDPEGYPLSSGVPVRVVGTYDVDGHRIASDIYIDQLTEEGRVSNLSLSDQQFMIERTHSDDTELTLTVLVEEQTTYRYREGEEALNSFGLSDLQLDELVIVTLNRNAENQLMATDVVRTSVETGASITNPAGYIRDDEAFVTVWEVSSGDQQIILPLLDAGEYNFTVDWGDDTPIEEVVSSSSAGAQHEYANPGIYDVVISGTLHGFAFNNHSDASKLLEITQWGDMRLSYDGYAGGAFFYGASNLDITATDAPDMTYTTTFYRSFMESGIGTSGNLNSWNVAAVTNMRYMFRDASAFNQDLSSWNVEAVTDMRLMLENTSFSTANYEALLVGWDALELQNKVEFGAGDATYRAGSAAEAARSNIMSTYSWDITDGGSIP